MKIIRLITLLMVLFGILAVTVSAITGPRDCFILKTIDSYVTVFRISDQTVPYITTEINEGVLRETDRLLLSAGIRVENETELWSILEDLGS